MNLKNKTNPYADELGNLFDACPKTVCAAIAVSALTTGGDHLSEARKRFYDEWQALYDAGVVEQKPPKTLLSARAGYDAINNTKF